MSDASGAKYVAIITDGNGRWAEQRGLRPIDGHEAGADVVKERLRDAVEFGIEELTVFSFSTENWSRPPEEVTGLMAMMRRRIEAETPELHDEGVRMIRSGSCISGAYRWVRNSSSVSPLKERAASRISARPP